jgi:hypothetical protein
MLDTQQDDPLVRSARREAAVALLVWVVALIYTMLYCARYGYHQTEKELTFVLGFPSWVFWGIVVPWAACVVISVWYAFWYMADDDLGEEEETPS